MSQASRSKPKDKKVGKEPLKVASKPSSANAGGGVPSNGYNPLFGTFHTLDTAPVSPNATLHVNGRFKNIDETDDLSGHSQGAGGEYETVSNNGSWSGESEDQKEKTSNLPIRQESSIVADNDKREKIRQKNEKKHQRQRERRAQELHEKCTGYLMSRKLEALAEQLVAMGFSSEQATMALILNEGRVEESVTWLFEGGEEANKDEEQGLDAGGNLKIDISEEFARIADMEFRFMCSQQDVERAVVTCEGDLEKAENMLRSQKQEFPAVPPKPEETSDPPTMGNGKLPIGATQNLTRVPVLPSSSSTVPSSSSTVKPSSSSTVKPSSSITIPSSSSTVPAKRDDKDFMYTKVVATAGPSMDPGSKNISLLKRAEPKLDWIKPPQVSVPVDKGMPNPGSNPSVSYSLASSLQVSPPPANTEAGYVAVGNEFKNLQIGTGTVREPVIVRQRPQSVNASPTPTSNVSSSHPGTAAQCDPNNIVGAVTPNGMIPNIPVTTSLSPNSVSNNQLYNQLHFQQPQRYLLYHPPQRYLQNQHPEEQEEEFVSSDGIIESPGTSWGNSLWILTGASQTQSIAAASSLGLFSGLGTNGTYGLSPTIDWDSNVASVLAYCDIDWSLDCSSSSSSPASSETGGSMWPTTNSVMQHYNPKYDSFYRGLIARSTASSVESNESGVHEIPGLQDGASTSTEETPAEGASRVWTSPFEERDLFSLPREFVTSPSL